MLSEEWKILAKVPFLDKAESPAATRALYVPWLSPQRNVYEQHYMWQRVVVSER